MPNHVAPNIEEKPVSAGEAVSIDFGGKLENGAIISSILSWTVDAGITLSSKVVTTAVVEINNRQVPIAEAVQCLVTGGTAGTIYKMTCQVTADDGTTPICVARIRVVAD